MTFMSEVETTNSMMFTLNRVSWRRFEEQFTLRVTRSATADSGSVTLLGTIGVPFMITRMVTALLTVWFTLRIIVPMTFTPVVGSIIPQTAR